jgi:hypothetical protein
MQNLLQLWQEKVYAACSSDGYTTTVTGYYKDESVAKLKSEADWSSAKEVVLYTDGKTFYEVRELGSLLDVTESERKEMLENIKNKLSPAELEFLKLHEEK